MKISTRALFHSITITLLTQMAMFVHNSGAQTVSNGLPTLNVQTKEMSIGIPYPTTWSVGPRRLANGYDLFNVPAGKLSTPDRTTLGQTVVTHDQYPSHAEALRQLRSIAAEEKEPATFLIIGGWPALQRRFVAQMGHSGDDDGPDLPDFELRVTTAIAAGATLVRLESSIPLTADSTVADDAQAIGQSVTFSVTGRPDQVEREFFELHRHPPSTAPAAVPPGPENNPLLSQPAKPSGNASPGLIPLSASKLALPGPSSPGQATRAYFGLGEIETVASSDGRSIVIAGNGGVAVSGNDGQTFTTAHVPGRNDNSLAVGVSGAFYNANISSAPGSNTTAIGRSTDGGSNFVFLINAVACSTNGPGCTVPDQEHIAADRFSAASGGGDQVYSVFRNCAPGCLGAMVTYSTDSGATWSSPIVVDSGGDFPRITIGSDSFVYIVYTIGGNRDGIRVKKYSSGDNGFVLQSTVDVLATGGATSTPGSASGLVACPVPGLDRCNDGNALDSPTAAVDDTNPNHIYVSYAQTTASGNEDIHVQDSIDGGATFPGGRIVRLNLAVPARRYMPWVSAVGGVARVSWYDRRAGTISADNSLTEFFAGSAFLDSNTNLVAGSEFKVSPMVDSNSQSGWPCAPRSTNDSESCSIQPEFAGVCSGGVTRCDFSTPTNCVSVPCQTGGGCPKYGDYNGTAAGAGRVFNAWASATDPQGNPSAFAVYFSEQIVCCVPQIQVTNSLSLPDSCVGNSNTVVLEVCNTGKEDLHVGPITSSSSQVYVTTPVSGYPVTISAGFCFPFQVVFAPTSPGIQSATLAIPSDDSVTPSASVSATGMGFVPSITCPVNIVTNSDVGVCGAVVNWPPPIVTSDHCPGAGVVCVPASGSLFPQGASSVSCTVTDSSGNEASCSFSVTVTQPTDCTIQVSGSPGGATICQGQSVILTAPNGRKQYIWHGPEQDGALVQTIVVSTAGTYTCTQVNYYSPPTCCSIEVVVNPMPNCLITGNLVITNGLPTTLVGPDKMTSQYWTGPQNNGIGTRSNTVITAGTYTLHIVDSNGCQNTCTATVLNRTPAPCTITVSGDAGGLTICHGLTSILTGANGMSSYLWSGPEQNGATAKSIRVGTQGTYTVQQIDGAGLTNSCSVFLTVHPLPPISIGALPSLTICQGSNTTLSGPSGMVQYLWLGPQNNGLTAPSNTVSFAGTYTLQITDSNGCQNSLAVPVTTVPCP